MNSKTNSTKTNKQINVADVYSVFVKEVNGRVCKLNFSDAKSQPYCGLDDFSVNMKKTGFAVYMSEANAGICTKVSKELVAEENAADTTKKQLRSRLVRFSDFELLSQCIAKVIEARFSANA